MATFVIQPVQKLLDTLHARIDTIVDQIDPDHTLKLDITMAFKDAQIQLLECLKDVSSKEYCSQLIKMFVKESFVQRPQFDHLQSIEINQKNGNSNLAHKSQMSARSGRLGEFSLGLSNKLIQSQSRLDIPSSFQQKPFQSTQLSPQQQQQLVILQRTQSLLLSKIEKLLQQDIPSEEEPHKHLEINHVEVSRQVEELSGYLGKVEEQIQTILKDIKQIPDRALDVDDLHAPPLTERADLKINNFVKQELMTENIEVQSEKPNNESIHIQMREKLNLPHDEESKVSQGLEQAQVPQEVSMAQTQIDALRQSELETKVQASENSKDLPQKSAPNFIQRNRMLAAQRQQKPQNAKDKSVKRMSSASKDSQPKRMTTRLNSNQRQI